MKGPRRPTRQSLPHGSPDWLFGSQTYYITVCATPRKRNHLCNRATAFAVHASLQFRHERHVWAMLACVLMPDHIHMLLQAPESTSVKSLVIDWKRFTRTHMGIIWQRDFFEHRLRRDEYFETKLEYLRQNPVRANLVKSSAEWPYFWTW